MKKHWIRAEYKQDFKQKPGFKIKVGAAFKTGDRIQAPWIGPFFENFIQFQRELRKEVPSWNKIQTIPYVDLVKAS